MITSIKLGIGIRKYELLMENECRKIPYTHNNVWHAVNEPNLVECLSIQYRVREEMNTR